MILRNKYASVVFNLLLPLSWLLFCMPSAKWFLITMAGMQNILNILLFLVIMGALLTKVWSKREHIRDILSVPQTTIPFLPAIMMVLCLIGYVAVTLLLEFNIVSCVFFLGGTYALTGFYIPYKLWIRGCIPTLLIILTLPFGTQLDIYFGFPLRLYVAESIQEILGQFNISGLTRETIVTIENRSAEVNASCSGLNGLWASWIFYFMITWINNLKPGFRWLILFATLNILVLSFNFLRIFILVILEVVLQYSATANIVHVPLGITGFIFSCYITWYLINIRFAMPGYLNPILRNPFTFVFTNTLASLTFRPRRIFQLSLSSLMLLYITFQKSPALHVNENHLITDLDFPMLNTCFMSISKGEEIVYKKERNKAKKIHFEYKDIKGTILVIKSYSWRGHHPPDLCLQSLGHTIRLSRAALIRDDFPVHILSLNNTGNTAVYWFQSPTGITHDHASRVWSEISGNESRWIMISMMLNKDPDQCPQHAKELFNHIQAIVNQYLKTSQTHEKNTHW